MGNEEAAALAGLVFGVVIGVLVYAGVIKSLGVPTRATLIERGIMHYCPDDGRLEFVGECE